MSPDDDHTPTQANLIIEPSQELDGFELYDNGANFLMSLGIKQDEVLAYPQILLSTIGSLLKQVDGYIGEIDDLNKELRHAAKLVKRLRAQRDVLRTAFQNSGIDPATVEGSGSFRKREEARRATTGNVEPLSKAGREGDLPP